MPRLFAPTPLPRPRLAARAGLWTAVAVFLGAALSRLLSFSGNTFSDLSFSLFWPPAGIGFALVWRYGLPGLWPLALGLGAWSLLSYHQEPLVAALAIVASCTGPAVGARVLRRLLRARPTAMPERRSGVRDLLAFYRVEVGIAAPLSALIGTLGFKLGGLFPASSALDVFLAYWLVDAIGGILFAPALLTLWQENIRPRQWLATLDRPTLAAAASIALALTLLAWNGANDYATALAYLYFPAIAACAMRREAATTGLTLIATAILILSAKAFATMDAQALRFAIFQTALVLLVAAAFGQILQAIAADRRAAYRKLARQAELDNVTDCLNERGFLTAMEHSRRERARRRDGRGLFILGVENLESAGHLVGLATIADFERELAARLRAEDDLSAVARLQPGVFAALLPFGSPAAVEEAFLRVEAGFRRGPLHLAGNGTALRLQPLRAGLYVPAQAQETLDEILIALREALSEAALKPDRRVLPEPVSRHQADTRRAHARRIEAVRAALGEGRIRLLAQPLVANRPLPSDAPPHHDFEVLVRVLDEGGNVIPMPEVIAALAQRPLALELDRAVIEAAFAHFAAHPEQLARVGKCALNLTGASLSDPDMLPFIRDRLRAHGLPTAPFAFEITESQAILNDQAASDLLLGLKALGCRIALDDFGTGLATYDYLKRFPVDYVKIDGAFVKDLESSPVDREIVASIVRVAHRLGVGTVAEFVHNAGVLHWVTDLEVGYSQGYALAPPRPLAELLAGPPVGLPTAPVAGA